MKKVRLLKVLVQPVVVVDDGETLSEINVQPVTVAPADWPTFATTAFLVGMDELQQTVDQAAGPPVGDVAPARPSQPVCTCPGAADTCPQHAPSTAD